MRWNTLGTLVLLSAAVSLCHSIGTQDAHAPAADKTYHFPTASLTIAGDLKDVKLKGTIAQLVRALQQPPSPASGLPPKVDKNAEPKAKTTGTKKIIHPSQLITKHTIAQKEGKKLYYGDPVPDSLTVSSQSVKVSQTSNTTGGKRSRHLGAYISNRPIDTKTVHGTRVPDDEEDKFYTWRNARVIKGFLVPNGKPANRHKKRQVIITDPQQYLAAAAAAQAQGATTIIDTSGLPSGTAGGGNNNAQTRASVFYAQEPAQGTGLSGNSGSQIFASGGDQRSHVAYPNQQHSHHLQQQQLHQVAHQATMGNGQTSAFPYNAQQANGHSMYVLQDGNAYNMQQYNAASAPAHQNNNQALLAQQQAQAQFYSRVGEASSSAPVASQSQTVQQSQHGSASRLQQQQSLSAAIRQQTSPSSSSSIDTQAIQAAVEAVQQLEAQQAAAAAAGASPGSFPQQTQSLQGAVQQPVPVPQQSAPAQTVVLPQGSVISGATAQEILAAAAAASNGQVSAQYIQIQPGQEQSLLQGLQQQQQQQQQQYPPANQFAERQNLNIPAGPAAAAYPASASQFVIQPQTYVAGAGGQTFTVPIPVPVEQANLQQNQQARHHESQQQHNSIQYHHQYQQHQQHPHHHQQQAPQQQHQFSSNSHNNHNNRQPQSQNPSITDRMKQAFNSNFNRKVLERVETNAVVPALASTGLFLGLSALAAGWYLSKSNREVGIVRRTGKFSKKSGAANNSADAKDKDAGLARTRRDLASMVTPGAYNPGGGPEVDQATFFQSIIQQSLEKTQKEYDDTPEQLYNQPEMSNDRHIGFQEPERHGPPSPPMPPPRHRSKFSRYPERPSKTYREDDLYDPTQNQRISKAQEKSGWSIHSAKNFARVAIPAVILTGAAIGICAVIFGWYISGDNREIAFLEPTSNNINLHGGGGGSYHRKKRSLSGSTALSDGWLIRTLKAIHGNPYDNMPAPTAKSLVPHPYFLDKDSSKTNSMEFKVSNNGLAGVLAGGAVLAVVALGLINSFSESSARNLKTGRNNHLLTSAYANKHTNPFSYLRSPRGMEHLDNEVAAQQVASNPSFFESIVSSLEASGDTIMNKLHELGSSDWHESPCTKRILCQVITSQGDDTVRLMEKKMAAIMKMLPDSVSSSVNKNYSDVLSAIYKRDCSAFTCSTQHHRSTQGVHMNVPSSTSHQQHHQSSITIEQTATNSR